MMSRVAKALSRTESYVIEDTLGVIALFALLYAGLVLSGAF
ncbi:MAG: hypothetical protein ACT4N9_06765 [Paracoccaceae bacterium]